MEPELKTGKRIVSKREYARQLAKRTGLILLAVNVFIGGMYTWGTASPAPGHSRGLGHDVFFSGMGFTAFWICCGMSKGLYKKAGRIQTGIPLTHANTAHLPAPDSLVRASAEPMQAQEAVLLRAAAQATETPPEQLVRAAGTKE